MKPITKATALFTALMSGLSGINANANSIHTVTHTIEQIKTLHEQQSPVEQIFENVAKLAQEIEAINTDIHRHFQQIKLSELNSLLLLNRTVSFAFDYLKQHYQQAIFTQCRIQFRTLSNAKNQLENHLQRLKEKLHGVEIVQIENLSLTAEELHEMNTALNARNAQ